MFVVVVSVVVVAAAAAVVVIIIVVVEVIVVVVVADNVVRSELRRNLVSKECLEHFSHLNKKPIRVIHEEANLSQIWRQNWAE